MRVRARIALPLVCLALLGASVSGRIWWMSGGKYLFQPRKWGEVEAGFYRSGQIHGRIVEDVLRENRIDLILDLASGDPEGDPDEAAERRAAERLGIRRLEWQLPGRVHGDPTGYVEALRELIRARAEGERVLVHCNAGRERTGALVAVYRMLAEGWSGEDAYREYASYHKERPPRPLLVPYLDEWLPEIAEALATTGDIPPPAGPLPAFGPAS